MIRTTLLVFLSIFIVAQQGCDAEDLDQDGWTIGEGDCDDHNPEVYPGAEETCNGMDDNCDGQIDEGLPTVTGYVDSDEDGYGLESEEIPLEQCVGLEGYVLARGDRADDVPTRYPGAEDFAGDGIDADCGGTDATDQHVGLTETSYPTIQAALGAAADGQVVWVGPGTYLENELSMSGKAIALRSTRGEDATVVDGQGAGTVILFVDGEGADSVLDGFGIAEGVAPHNCPSSGSCGYDGGGMYLDKSSPSLTQVSLCGNNTSDDGGCRQRAFRACRCPRPRPLPLKRLSQLGAN